MPNRKHPVVRLVATLAMTAPFLLAGAVALAAGDADQPRADLPRLELASEDGFLSVEPVVLLQPGFLLRVDRDARYQTEGSGFLLKKGEAGLKAHVGEAVFFKLVGAYEHGEAEVVDAYVHVDPFGGAIALRAGYFKPPVSRQFLTTDARRQMADEAVALDLVEPGELLGIQLGGMLFELVEYTVGAWLLADELFAITTGASEDITVGGRLVLHPLDPLPAEEEPDLIPTGSPRLAVGGFAIYDRREGQLVPLAGIGDVSHSDNRLRLGGELAGKWRGASLSSEVFFSRVWVTEDVAEEIAARLPPVRGIGAYLQLGYFAIHRRLELAARFDVLDPDLEIAGLTIHPGLGIQVYAIGHALKVMAMYRLNMAIDDPFPAGSPLHTPTTNEVFLVLQGAI
jgi:hypothetical protein